MRRISFLALASLMVAVVSLQTASAQFPIKVKIPRVPKVEKPKQEQPKVDDSGSTQRPDTTASIQESKPASSGSKRVYEQQYPTDTPVFVKSSVYIRAETHKKYWKFPNVKNYSSWAPKVRFNLFYNEKEPLGYTAAYFNPDGSLWFSETLEGTSDVFVSDRAITNQMLETKSSAATGTYGIKITNTKSGEVLFQGKFTVGKFLPPNSEKNEFDFFVDHDWLLPIGYLGFEPGGSGTYETGGFRPVVSVWLKDTIDRKELEARLFYKGQQIATTANDGGGISDSEERASEFSALSAPLHYWKLRDFFWENFRFANGGGFNRDYHPNATYADESPGEYMVRVYRNGVQVREAKFTVGADGRFVDGYAKQIFIPYHKIIIPVKVVGTTEKWNALSWKTDAFYGNPLSGFDVP